MFRRNSCDPISVKTLSYTMRTPIMTEDCLNLQAYLFEQAIKNTKGKKRAVII